MLTLACALARWLLRDGISARKTFVSAIHKPFEWQLLICRAIWHEMTHHVLGYFFANTPNKSDGSVPILNLQSKSHPLLFSFFLFVGQTSVVWILSLFLILVVWLGD